MKKEMRTIAGMLLAIASSPGYAEDAKANDLADLSLEELGNIEVTSVSRRPERLSDAAASIFVITGEDIRRSGATSLPEALRLAPNLQVARVDAKTYAITARGFNNAIGNKLLVVIDGRTVYSPLFSGVFWDQQDVMLEDVDRIEVISGPGAAQWGANAVNGVINVITRHAGDTQGVLASVTSGNTEGDRSLRYGGKLGEDGAYRVYGKFSDRNRTALASGAPVLDGWSTTQAGFRADWAHAGDSFTVQGDANKGSSDQTALGAPNFSGANLLARWSRKYDDGSDLRVQAYLDHADRDDLIMFRDRMQTFDVDAQYGMVIGDHRLQFGGGNRVAHDRTIRSLLVDFIPGSRSLRWTNLFVQDEVKLSQHLQFTAGAKLESNIYTGWEFLPTARLAWKPDDRQLVWTAFSRAVRAPARLDTDFFFPGNPLPIPGNLKFIINGGPGFESEISNVIELGYRAQPTSATSYSITLFRNMYDKLRSGQPPPAVIQNMIDGNATGLEMWGSYQVTPDWRLTGGITTLTQRLQVEPGSTDPTGPSALGNDPDYQWMLRSLWNVSARVEFDVMVRHVAALPNPVVPAYNAVDARLGWRVNRQTDISFIVRNGFDPSHPEFAAAPGRSEIPRSAMLRLTWKQ